MYNFEKYYENFVTERDDRISITSIRAKGANMGQMVSNIEVYAKDWHGNSVDMPFESLHRHDEAVIRADIAAFLHIQETDFGNGGEPVRQYSEYE